MELTANLCSYSPFLYHPSLSQAPLSRANTILLLVPRLAVHLLRERHQNSYYKLFWILAHERINPRTNVKTLLLCCILLRPPPRLHVLLFILSYSSFFTCGSILCGRYASHAYKCLCFQTFTCVCSFNCAHDELLLQYSFVIFVVQHFKKERSYKDLSKSTHLPLFLLLLLFVHPLQI